MSNITTNIFLLEDFILHLNIMFSLLTRFADFIILQKLHGQVFLIKVNEFSHPNFEVDVQMASFLNQPSITLKGNIFLGEYHYYCSRLICPTY